MSTDIEGAMQLALSTFPVQGARRILLISDGNENRGSADSSPARAGAGLRLYVLRRHCALP